MDGPTATTIDMPRTTDAPETTDEVTEATEEDLTGMEESILAVEGPGITDTTTGIPSPTCS
jgi:hypothetical protein